MWMEGAQFIGDIRPEYLPQHLLDGVEQTLNKIPLTFVRPDICSANMIANLARVTSTGAQWYLIQPITRQSFLYLLHMDVPLPVSFLL